MSETILCWLKFIDGHKEAITALATLIIAAGTIALFFVTGRAANAANLNAQAVINAERAHLIIDDIEIRIPEQPIPRFPIITILNYKFTNYGKTPAFIIEAAIRFEKRSDLPVIPDYGKPEKVIGAVIPPTKTITPFGIMGVSVSQSEWGEQEGKLGLFVYGFIRYKDIFEKSHIPRFAYQWNRGGGLHSHRMEEFSNSNYWEYT